MASIRQEVLEAIGTALDITAVTTLAAGGVWNGKAQDDASYSYVVFDWQAFDPVDYTFTFAQAIEGGLLRITAYSDEDSDISKAPQDLNNEILEACETILHAGITLNTKDLMHLRKYADIPIIEEQLSDRTVFGTGRLYRVIAQ